MWLPNKSIQTHVFRWIFISLSIVTAVYCLKNPIRFWDMLPYMGSVVSIDRNDALYIHTTTYAEFNRYATDEMKASMIEGHSFCKNLSTHPQLFYEQLPFFKIKMLFVWFAWLLYKLGIPLYYSVLIPSALALIGISLIIYQWLSRHFKSWIAFVVSTLLLVSNLSFDAFRIASPDAMAAFFILVSAFFYLEKKNLYVSLPFLLLAMMTRVDYILFTGFLMVFIMLFDKEQNKKRIYFGVGGLILSVALFFIAKWLSGGYDAWRMFYRSFVILIENPYSANIPFNIDQYLGGLREGLRASMHNKTILILPVLLILFYMFYRMKPPRGMNLWMIAMLGSFVLRIFVHPLFEMRYIFIFIIILILLLILKIGLIASKRSIT